MTLTAYGLPLAQFVADGTNQVAFTASNGTGNTVTSTVTIRARPPDLTPPSFSAAEVSADGGNWTSPMTIVTVTSAAARITLQDTGLGLTPSARTGETVTFNNTGADQSFVVPAGVTSITVKAWGAGGGGGGNGAPAGGGGYATSAIPVTPGETLTIIAGSQGVYRAAGAGPGPAVYGGGGNTGSQGYGGQGGGRSALRRSSTELLTAGGGGGGGWDNGASEYGGAGGGTTGADGAGTRYGLGGTQSAGGAGGGSAQSGSAFQGGTSNDGDGGGGGGGGGGYYGGGAGSGQNPGGGAGGGSSYIPDGGSTLGGSGTTPGNASDADRGTAAAGGSGGSDGHPGAVVIRYNTTGYSVQYTTNAGVSWSSAPQTSVSDMSGSTCSATGGTITRVNGYCVHTFTGNDTFTPAANVTAQVLVVAGGGSGGGASGGGGGGVINNTTYAITGGQPVTVTVGAGGATKNGNGVGNNGSNSVFGALTAIGGGGGGSYSSGNGSTGGSGGGGGACNTIPPGSGTSGQGNSGGDGSPTCNPYTSGGGGGAGAVGGSASGSTSGSGGIGILINIDGNDYYYGGGGGGGAQSASAGNGGLGGGGGGAALFTGAAGSGGGSARNTGGNGQQVDSYPPCDGGAGGANTGGGGGGMGVSVSNGGAGGSGIVIVRYLPASTMPVTLTAYGLPLAQSVPDGTNQIAFTASDMGNNMATSTFTIRATQPEGVCSCGGNPIYVQQSGLCSSIQCAVDSIPASYSGDLFIYVDTSTYSEAVTVRGKAPTDNSRIFIQLDPAIYAADPDTAAVVNPPAGSTAAFQIMNASVTIAGINIISTNSVAWGVLASSPSIAITSVNVQDAAGNIWGAGMSLGSYDTVSYSSVTVANASAYAFYLSGSSMTVVSYSSAQAANADTGALYLTDASANAFTVFLASNPAGYGAYLLNSNSNTISQSTMTGYNEGLYLNGASSNTISGNYIYGPNGNGAALDPGSNGNSINQSAITGDTFGLYLNGASSNAVIGNYMYATNGDGVLLNTGANFNSISQSTMTGTIYGLYLNGASSNAVTASYMVGTTVGANLFTNSNGNTITQSTMTGTIYGLYFGGTSSNTASGCYIQGSKAVLVSGSTGTIIAYSTLVSTWANGIGLQLSGGSVNLTLTSSTVQGGIGGEAISLDQGNTGAINLSSDTITSTATVGSPYYGLLIATQGAEGCSPAFLSPA